VGPFRVFGFVARLTSLPAPVGLLSDWLLVQRYSPV
jgi:hypothetical protein